MFSVVFLLFCLVLMYSYGYYKLNFLLIIYFTNVSVVLIYNGFLYNHFNVRSWLMKKQTEVKINRFLPISKQDLIDRGI